MGLAWVKVGDAGWQGPIAKYLSDAETERGRGNREPEAN